MLHVGNEDGDTILLACGDEADELEGLSHTDGLAEMIIVEERLWSSKYRNRALGEWHRRGESPKPYIKLIRLRYL